MKKLQIAGCPHCVEYSKRIEELERRVRELEAQPREQHAHFHSHPPVYIQPNTPPAIQPKWPYEPYKITCGGISDSPLNLTNAAGGNSWS